MFPTLTKQRVFTLLLAVCAVACGWNFSRIEPVSVSSPAPSTLRRGGDGIQVHGAIAHLDKLKSSHSSKQIHTLSPAGLPMGRTTVMLTPGSLAGDVHSDRFPVNSDCVDHSRAPPARV